MAGLWNRVFVTFTSSDFCLFCDTIRFYPTKIRINHKFTNLTHKYFDSYLYDNVTPVLVQNNRQRKFQKYRVNGPLFINLRFDRFYAANFWNKSILMWCLKMRWCPNSAVLFDFVVINFSCFYLLPQDHWVNLKYLVNLTQSLDPWGG